MPTVCSRFQHVCAALGIRHLLLRPNKTHSDGNRLERFFHTNRCRMFAAFEPLFTFAARNRAVEDFVWYAIMSDRISVLAA